MSTSVLQQARQQKVFYFGAILVLFTISLIHREFILKPQATRLQLIHTVRGQADLTSSAVMLSLSGSRGLVVTYLWYNAMEAQKRSEWNEVELIVNTITKLQPYFITPWLYQSWNIAFNVSVECDRTRDKYFYISRGLALLAEGERRNSGYVEQTKLATDPDRIVIPGNPELRHFMGFIYQLKIGNSDERLTMRSLLELSCINPIKRHPDRFRLPGANQQVNLDALAKFCQEHPRLIRRLHEQRSLSDEQIVQFLSDNQGIPSLYDPLDKANVATETPSELKADPRERFPILPLPRVGLLDPRSPDRLREPVDVFLVCRTWYEFAQEPLPPPDRGANVGQPTYDKMRYRAPKGIVTQLFRGYPARAQVYFAEALNSEGFFDSDGWNAQPAFHVWARRQGIGLKEHTYGTDSIYHSRVAWQRGFEAYRDYGVKNGFYLSPAEVSQLTALASIIRKQENLQPGQIPPVKPEWRQGKLKDSFDAHVKLYNSEYYRNLSNIDAFIDQSEAEADAITATARKHLFTAERLRKYDPTDRLLAIYEEGWKLYTHACLKFPRFAQVTTMQDETYEMYQIYLGLSQKHRGDEFKRALTLGGKIGAFWSMSPGLDAIAQYHVVGKLEQEKDPSKQMLREILPARQRYGDIDLIHYYDGAGAKDLKDEFLHPWLHAAGFAVNMSVPQAIAFPNGHEYYLATLRTSFRRDKVHDEWRPLIASQTRDLFFTKLSLK